MKTKKMRIFSKLFAALVVLTLISCCFMGTTFARYLSTTTGTASVNVAEWGIAFADGDTTSDTKFNVEFADLSPDMTERTESGTSSKRTHSTGKVLVGTIENTGDVTALVTINYENADSAVGGPYEVVTLKKGKDYDATGYDNNSAGGVTGSGASKSQVYSLFSIELYYGYDENASTTPLASGQQVSLAGKNDVGNNNRKIWIFAECVWTTHDELNPWVADAIDTWAGENVTKVSYTLNITAAQASEAPIA